MNRKVIISKTAEKKLSSLFEYLLENWSAKVKSNFIKKLDHNIDIIKLEPETFPESQKDPGLRKCVITKQTTLYYRFDSDQIKIVTIFDTRQNPDKLEKEL
ncbi:plasmid stabilization system protein ParE [Gillisia mitskevichiae]|uniref:Plasmid stabilization system protein ParE n=1 Tax=Gillisia mitskevichiae TaxID=270921 RepID=A0A495P028_9FLAO|nr:type II toxin-antitoxin system RelE/ParE family toxin [Gillisia mitskevichiae]RKS42752.1 plasmid stabilization system protein ParE [Gillisia mitskevichiae]